MRDQGIWKGQRHECGYGNLQERLLLVVADTVSLDRLADMKAINADTFSSLKMPFQSHKFQNSYSLTAMRSRYILPHMLCILGANKNDDTFHKGTGPGSTL